MRIFTGIFLLCLSAGTASAEFSLRFDSWGDIPFCNNGNPKSVNSPAFVLTDIPAGTTTVQFYFRNLNTPAANRGGSKRLAVPADGRFPAGTFKYRGPCPINGVNTYEWKVTARNGNRVSGNAKARRDYPE
ncbi:hypothetical protein [Shimia haliotis]|uniref:Uncharacterized protein n=1 Tax=Shimia haliotis TaxID=1280847 RepID=A0A1I4FID2_9RHOB|nr:hypothetical protein [Shimia haliotis]SFL17209.1 hypothetical protein SAMN04488036_10645 [Shimia haliotis]